MTTPLPRHCRTCGLFFIEDEAHSPGPCPRCVGSSSRHVPELVFTMAKSLLKSTFGPWLKSRGHGPSCPAVSRARAESKDTEGHDGTAAVPATFPGNGSTS
jgi:hypothetical protein